jgi:tRNA pseudouridine55 synthase
VNIVIVLNKPRGISSHDAVTRVKKIFKVRKAGHAGTLDPLATGILLVCLNEATKISCFLSEMDKEYIVTAKLGQATDTHDAEGIVTKQTSGFHITGHDICEAYSPFVGAIEQTPPMHSAIKVSGKPLYKLARRGIEVERRARKVEIYMIELISYDSPFFTLCVSCSRGTYIRSLCHDIGEMLGVGAHVTELVRTRIGTFRLKDSAGLDELPLKTSAIHSIDSALSHLSEIGLGGEELKKAKNGNPVPIDLLPKEFVQGMHSHCIRLKDTDGKLFGIGKIAKGIIKIQRLLRF